MNKNIKVKQLVQCLPDSAKIIFCGRSFNGDSIKVTNCMHVGDAELYSTYKEQHIRLIEIIGNTLYITI